MDQETRDMFHLILNKLDSFEKEMKSEMAEMKTDIAEVKTDVAELKTDVAALKTDVAELKTDMAEVKSQLSDVQTRLVEVESLTRMQIQATTELSDKSDEQYIELKSEMKYISGKYDQQERVIKLLNKNRVQEDPSDYES
ncbi:hypothetical protein BHU72_05120 [Desulfuribacillus stibiiarsenatis]|uniref:Uncharacterized protein n=1 Tax=Desulfuribacillus stibiiarsenatis TaxID=1390249 RepID=A0A1E5L606_9FIRM|nr:hypothetical protein [Desulfuribacillus stibiiarsenatis]OEH85468.1 hypothetical protein BHU72_05120 [Desulfuribacillus stibiiarsenatis]